MKHFLGALALAFAGITTAGAVPAQASNCAPGVVCTPPPCHVKPAACPNYGTPALIRNPIRK